MKKCIILANGRAPQKNVISFLKKNGYNFLLCADGGANSARKLGLIPDVIIGDLDSITTENLNYFRQKTEIIQLARQNDTDVEKCLKHAIRKGYSEVILTGVTGDRLDHTFCNLGIVIKFFTKIKIRIIAESSILTPYKDNMEITTIPGETFSLYGLDTKTKITSSGLKYPLRNAVLPFGQKESTSNVALSDKVTLKVNGGIIFVIRNFQVSKKVILVK